MNSNPDDELRVAETYSKLCTSSISLTIPLSPLNPNIALYDALIEAYGPCKHFGVCPEAKWSPERGHIPRGFLGATSSLADVEVIMVFAEPGHPHADEGHDSTQPPRQLLESGLRHTHDCFRNGVDLFHRNVRWFLDQLYPCQTFDEQLKHAWLTEGRLCSIENEIGKAEGSLCAKNYLARQMELLPNATVVAFGVKAQHYLQRLRIAHLKAFALSPPGANFKPARPSWKRAIAQIEAQRVG